MKFETYRTDTGRYRWRVRDDEGKIVPIKPGRIMGLKGSPEAEKRSREAVQLILKRRSEADAAARA